MIIYKIITIFTFFTWSCLIGIAQKMNINAFRDSIKPTINTSGDVSCITKACNEISPIYKLGLSFQNEIFCKEFGDNVEVKSNNGYGSTFMVKSSLNLTGK